MAFDPDLFDEFYSPNGMGMGRLVLWERSRICACFNSETGNAFPGCESCFGAGRCYDPGIKLWTGVVGYDMKKHRKEFGVQPDGTSVLSIPRNALLEDGGTTRQLYDQVAEFDRFVLLHDVERRELPLTKGKQDNHMQAEIVEVLSVRTSRQHLNELRWVEGEDFVIQTHSVRWLKGPIDGTSYVLDIRTKPTLYIYGAEVSHRNHGGLELPRRILAAPADVFDRSRRVGKPGDP